MEKSTEKHPIQRVLGNQFLSPELDIIAREEPLEIRLVYGPKEQRQSFALSVTMRTPGHDFDLVRGFLCTEGILARPEDLLTLRYGGSQLAEASQENVVIAELSGQADFQPDQVQRHFYTSSSCGVCGKASLDMVRLHSRYSILPNRPLMSPNILQVLPAALRTEQFLFAQTGGIHAAALFNEAGELLLHREDVGRHNAMDKLLGAAWKADLLPLRDQVCLLSGRASFELCQKAYMGGLAFLAAIGAPSSLAIEFAEEYGMTLIGFLREEGFNIYAGPERIPSKGSPG